MPLRNLTHDREPQSAARRAGGFGAIEAIENPPPFLGGNAGPGIGHDQARLPSFARPPHRRLPRTACNELQLSTRLPSITRKASGISHDQDRGAPDNPRSRRLASAIDARSATTCRAMSVRLTDRQWLLCGFRLVARQRQELLNQAGRPLNAAFQFGKGRRPLGIRARAFRQLYLQPHRGERRAQLVRGIRDKRSLQTQRATEPCAEERSARQREASPLAEDRCPAAVQARPAERLPTADATSLSGLKPRPTVTQIIANSTGSNISSGSMVRKAKIGRQLLPHARRLGDLHDIVADDRAVNAPVSVAASLRSKIRCPGFAAAAIQDGKGRAARRSGPRSGRPRHPRYPLHPAEER